MNPIKATVMLAICLVGCMIFGFSQDKPVVKSKPELTQVQKDKLKDYISTNKDIIIKMQAATIQLNEAKEQQRQLVDELQAYASTLCGDKDKYYVNLQTMTCDELVKTNPKPK